MAISKKETVISFSSELPSTHEAVAFERLHYEKLHPVNVTTDMPKKLEKKPLKLTEIAKAITKQTKL